MMARALISGGFAVAGSVLFGIGTASADDADAALLDGPSALLGALTQTAAGADGVVSDLPVDNVAGALVHDDGLLQDKGLLDTSETLESDNLLDVGDTLDAGELLDVEAGGAASLVREVVEVGRSSEDVEASTLDQSATRAQPVPAAEVGNGLASTVTETVHIVVEVVSPAAEVPDLSAVTPLSTGAPLGILQRLTAPVADLAPVFDVTTGTVAPLAERLDLPFTSRADLESIIDPLGTLPGSELGLMSSADKGGVLPPSAPVSAPGASSAAPVGSQAAALHYSLDSSQDDQPSPTDSGEGDRPSMVLTPAAGLTGLLTGAPGAVSSVDQTGSTSHALLPEEAVQRARLISAAAYAWTVDGVSQREATKPPVSPD
jgi:hypothetical protein